MRRCFAAKCPLQRHGAKSNAFVRRQPIRSSHSLDVIQARKQLGNDVSLIVEIWERNALSKDLPVCHRWIECALHHRRERPNERLTLHEQE
jgi:hypothetical protein